VVELACEVEHESVEKVGAGKDVGIKVTEVVREHDTVYVVEK
jgi:hypothetical protein